jgi:uncharacterized protein
MRNKKIISILVIFIGLFIILPLVFFISSCSSSKGAISKTTELQQSKITESAEISYPTYNGFINDYTNTLTEEWKVKTEQLTANVKEGTSCEIAVAVIDNLNGISIEEYAVELFNKWGVGKKDKDNGVLLLVVMADHKLRIEVGYGLEGIITDLEAKEIIDNVIVPRFKENNYNSGIYNGVIAIANKIYEEEGKAAAAYSDTVESTPKKSFSESKAFPVVIILITLLPWFIIGGIFGAGFLTYFIKTHKCPKCHKIGLIVKQTILVKPTYESPGRAEIEQRCRYCRFYEKKTTTISKLSKYYSSGSSWSSSSSFSSSSSSSHSSSSFGGGSSGGGGASGSW